MLLKGVNKRVVEISATDNEYFERAIFIVRCEKDNTDSNTLDRQAQSFINHVTCKNVDVINIRKIKSDTKKRIWYKRFIMAGCITCALAAIGAVLVAIM